MAENESDTKLTPRQERFVEEYSIRPVGADAARKAGYSVATAANQAYELLRMPKIRAAIDKRCAELSMGKGEILRRLTLHAQGSIAPFLSTDGRGRIYIDLNSDEVQEHLHLIKGIKQTEHLVRDPDDPENFITETKTEVVLHDAQGALEKLGKANRLFVNVAEVSGPGGAPLDVNLMDSREKLDKALEGIAERLSAGKVKVRPAPAPPQDGVFLKPKKTRKAASR